MEKGKEHEMGTEKTVMGQLEQIPGRYLCWYMRQWPILACKRGSAQALAWHRGWG